MGRSYCESCKHKLSWYDLFPIFSYISLQGRCRYCKHKLSSEYLLIEVVMGILVTFLFWQNVTNFKFEILNFQTIQFILELIFKTFFITILATLFLTDLKEMFIPDRIVLPAIILSVIYLVSIIIYKIGYLYNSLSQNSLGQKLLPPYSEYFQRHAFIVAEPLFWGLLMGLAIGGFFLSLILITKGKGMGGGDVKLGAFIGLVLGFPQGLLAIMLSFLTGAIFSIILIILGKKHFGQSIPFGPFLVLGSLIALFWSQEIIDWYLHLTI